MTSTLREFHGQALRLNVLDQRVEGDVYSRSINLALQANGRIVEYGFVRMDMRLVPPSVRAEILEKATPLGDILIKHRVLRRIDPKWFLRFGEDSPMLEWFGTSRPAEAFGRLGVIHCDGQAAIELLEVVPIDGEAVQH